jgi:predicted secreted protein
MAGIDAFGTTWAMATGGGTSYTNLADVTSIDVLDVKADTIDVTAHDSASGWREFIGGLKDAGELSMDINYDPAAHGTIFSNIGSDAVSHKITLPDAGAAVVTFDGIITGMKAQAPYDDKLSATVTVKVTGAPTITP